GIENIMRQMEDITHSTQAVLEVIKQLNDKTGEINKIVELITHISDQTNLLALNAAIEAARAGDAGRGFAVVAEEVRKLAEQSNAAAKDILTLVQAIQAESSGAVDIAGKGSDSVKLGTRVIMEVGNSFKNIIDSVQKLSGEIQEVASSTVEMSQGMQRIAAISEEQNAVMEEVAASSQTMANTAQELNHIASLFKR
ncbi:MAG: methyl-accepting chemotaxis protein, partial [Firmicutes bacterium]|nr:methyl-accepting chemotaxis protein [Bacillota bacterium]